MNTPRLTIIITFLNERDELRETLQDMRNHLSEDVDIILVNDASTDNYNYASVALEFGAKYVENRERLGIGASRNKGVELCETPYFLLLDAHMRFYDNKWLDRIIEELEKDSRSLLCCQTHFLSRNAEGVLITPDSPCETKAAHIVYNAEGQLLDSHWQMNLPAEKTYGNTVPVVCVLGATYACNKAYWQYLKGLEGLTYFGSDEPYISMKVWMEGGSCKLLQDVVIGHIYRINTVPYNIDIVYRLYNQILISNLFLPSPFRKDLWATGKTNFDNYFPQAIFILYERRHEIFKLKEYYQSIFKNDFCFFENMNREYKISAKSSNLTSNTIDADLLLKEIIQKIGVHQTDKMTISAGLMGVTIFLFHYSRFTQNVFYKEYAENLVDLVVEDVKLDIHFGLESGIAGVGWFVMYLYQNKFIEGNINEILEEYDKKIMEVNPARIVNLGKEYGLGGIVLYVLSRLYTIEKEELKNPFDKNYLHSIYSRSKMVLEQTEICDSIDVFFDFVNYYEHIESIQTTSVFDICHLPDIPASLPKNSPLGLNGLSGIGLRLLLEKEYFKTI